MDTSGRHRVPIETEGGLSALLLTTTVIVCAYRDGLQFWAFDQAQCNAEVM